MPSWVVPAVAAELWSVSVEHILAEAANGRVRSRKVASFLFVDIDPAVEGQESEDRPQPYRRSLAWAPSVTTVASQPQPIITPAERNALLDEDETPLDDGNQPADEAVSDPVSEKDVQPDWKKVRQRVGTQRRPPSSRDAA